MSIRIEGRGNISATIIADSVSETTGKRITTYELEYPRFIHSEFMTHRLFSRNAASSRAIPVEKMIEFIKTKTAMPIHWGKNQPGMSAKEECDELIEFDKSLETVGGPFNILESRRCKTKIEAWYHARDQAIDVALRMHHAGYHKQIVNRLLEPFTFIKVVCTATEYDNFFWLRKHTDAQPEIQELAACTWDARLVSIPRILKSGDWHVPYYEDGLWTPDMNREYKSIGSGFFGLDYYITNPYWIDVNGVGLRDAISISSSCCAQVSYRKNDDSLDKARTIYKKLVESTPVHASPFEHQATPISVRNHPNNSMDSWDIGITHRDRENNLWSGNFNGWIQHRQLINNHTCWNYQEGA